MNTWDYKPLINFRAIYLTILVHVVSNRRAGIRQYTTSALILALRFFSGKNAWQSQKCESPFSFYLHFLMMSNGSSKNKVVYVVSFSQTEKQSGYFFSVFTLTPGLWFGCSRFLVLCKSKLGFSQMYTHLYSNIRLFGSIVMAAIQKKGKNNNDNDLIIKNPKLPNKILVWLSNTKLI